MKKIFITGGAGFIGSHLVSSLLKDGKNGTVYDSLAAGRREFLEENKKLLFIQADVLDNEKLNKEMKGHDFVFHLSANADIPKGNDRSEIDLKQTFLSTINVLEAMRKNKIKNMAFSSSSAVLGDPRVFPADENYGYCEPISLYGAAKLSSEAYISAYVNLFKINAWVFRFANIVGSRSTHGVIYDFIRKLRTNPKKLEILGDGNQTKSYLHVEDCVNAMLYVINHTREAFNLYNISGHDTINVKRIAEIVTEEMKLKPKFLYTGTKGGWKGDVVRVQLGNNKIQSLGWKPIYNSEEAVRQAVRSLLEN